VINLTLSRAADNENTVRSDNRIMCLAVPMQIVETDGISAKLEVGGITTEADVSLIEDASPGDFVIIHAGFAIERLDEKEAAARLELFGQLAELERSEKHGLQP